jgi:hypothetical protein
MSALPEARTGTRSRSSSPRARVCPPTTGEARYRRSLGWRRHDNGRDPRMVRPPLLAVEDQGQGAAISTGLTPMRARSPQAATTHRHARLDAEPQRAEATNWQFDRGCDGE